VIASVSSTRSTSATDGELVLIDDEHVTAGQEVGRQRRGWCGIQYERVLRLLGRGAHYVDRDLQL